MSADPELAAAEAELARRKGVPDSADPVLAEAERELARRNAKPKRGVLDYIPAVPIAETAANLVSGGAGAVAGGISGAATIATNALGLTDTNPADRVRQVQDAVTYEPRTATGQRMSHAVALPFEKLANGAEWAGGKATDALTAVGASPEVAASAGAGLNAGIQLLPQLVGKVAAPYAKAAVKAAGEKAATLAKQNAPTDAIVKEALDKGMSFSPAEANPTLLNRILEGIGGQAKTQKLISSKNQPVVNEIARRSLGIPSDTPLGPQALEAVRKNAGRSYEAVRKLGDVSIDEQYMKDLSKIEEKYVGAAESFKDEPSPVQKAVESARNTVEEGRFNSSAAVDKIKLERAKADKAFRQGDTELGKAHKAIADAIEDQIDRHIDSVSADAPVGGADVANFRKAREIIARSYDVQKSLKGGENVDARVLAAQLKKGKKLGGDLKLAAQAADKFPGSFESGSKNAYVGPTFFDAAAGLASLGGTLFHHGTPEAILAALAATAARPTLRAGIASRPYQNLAIEREYGPGAMRRLSEIATTDPALSAEALAQAKQREQKR